MNWKNRPRALAAGFLIWGAIANAPAAAQDAARSAPDRFIGAGISPRLGAEIDLDLEFTDESGRTVTLGDYFNGERPVALTLNYYECPSLCVLQLQGLLDTLKQMEWTAGGPFDVLTVSINPEESPALAAEKKAAYIEGYGRPEAAAGWHFLTGQEPAIRALSETVGFGYVLDDESGEFIHDSAVFICTPQGKVQRLLYGIAYDPATFKMALLKASNGRAGSLKDKIAALSYRYDEQSGRYVFQSGRLMRILAGLSVAVSALGLAVLLALGSKRKKAAAALEAKS